MASPAERKALVFSVGPVRLALRVSLVREVVPLGAGSGEVSLRGGSVTALPLAVALGIDAGPATHAIVTEGEPRALAAGALHGIVDLDRAEVFQLPARTPLPQPPPYLSAIAVDGEVALELAVDALGWAPLAAAADPPGPPLEVDVPTARELLFARGARVLAVPLSLLVHVLDAPAIRPVPLAPASHLGVAYHGRAIHPVIDPAAWYGDRPASGAPANVLLVDAGGVQVGLAADRILQAGAVVPAAVSRPAWDALFAQ